MFIFLIYLFKFLASECDVYHKYVYNIWKEHERINTNWSNSIQVLYLVWIVLLIFLLKTLRN